MQALTEPNLEGKRKTQIKIVCKPQLTKIPQTTMIAKERPAPREQVMAQIGKPKDVVGKAHTNWEIARQKWLTNKKEKIDVPHEIEHKRFPFNKEGIKNCAEIMKSVRGPYEQFEGYYRLQDVVDLYEEIWYEEEDEY